MTVSEELALSCYREIAAIDENHAVTVVQHVPTGNIYVKKVLNVYNPAVFRFLKDHHVRGTPEIIEAVEDDGRLTVIEEYISGHTLQSVIDNGNTFSEEQAVAVMEQICGILRKLHGAAPPIVHRDIKPSNIIITPDGDVRLLDMNAAKLYSDLGTEDTTLIGTVGYAAPEQYGFGVSGTQADIYSAGILLNVMLTGVPPKEKLAAGRLGKVIGRCTMLDPRDRYGTVDELLHDLRMSKTAGGRRIYHSPGWMIPGFRSGNATNMVVALLGYAFIFSAGLTMAIPSAKTEALRWTERIFFILCSLVVVFLSSDYLGVWKRFRIDRVKNPFLKALCVLLLDAAAFLVLLLGMIVIEARF